MDIAWQLCARMENHNQDLAISRATFCYRRRFIPSLSATGNLCPHAGLLKKYRTASFGSAGFVLQGQWMSLVRMAQGIFSNSPNALLLISRNPAKP